MALEHFNLNLKDYNIVISDMRMPGMNGNEFVKKVKEIKSEVKVILMSTFEITDREFHKGLQSVKIDAFLQKPFSIKQLEHLIEQQTSNYISVSGITYHTTFNMLVFQVMTI